MADELEELKEEGDRLFEAEAWNEVIFVCTKILELNSKSINAFFNRGGAHYNKGNYGLAIEDFDQIIKLDPQNSFAFFNRGFAYDSKGEYDRAIEDYDQVIKLDPQNINVLNDRGLAYDSKGDYDRAIEDYDQVIKLDPQNINAFTNRGLSYYNKGDHDHAIEDYDQAIKLDPKNTKIFTNRGSVYDSKGDHDHAVENFNQAIKLDPQNTNAFNNLGLAYAKKGEYDRAIEDYDQAIKIDPQYKNAIHNRAVAMALRQAAAEQEEIRKKYEAELENYKSDVLEAKKYKEREEDYKKKIRIIDLIRWILLAALFGLGAVSYGALIYFNLDVLSKSVTDPWIPLRLFPFAVLITLILSSLVWIIRLLGHDRDRLWALREDAYTCGMLTLLINEPQVSEVKLELILKLFEHHDQSSTAELIANWDKPQQVTPNLGDVIKTTQQKKSE